MPRRSNRRNGRLRPERSRPVRGRRALRALLPPGSGPQDHSQPPRGVLATVGRALLLRPDPGPDRVRRTAAAVPPGGGNQSPCAAAALGQHGFRSTRGGPGADQRSCPSPSDRAQGPPNAASADERLGYRGRSPPPRVLQHRLRQDVSRLHGSMRLPGGPFRSVRAVRTGLRAVHAALLRLGRTGCGGRLENQNADPGLPPVRRGARGLLT